VTTFGYDAASGLLVDVEDPLARHTTIDAYDLAARPTQETLPGGRVVGFGWDANGNLTSLTPPGRPAHTFEHTAVDLESEYEPPAVAPSPPWPTATTWDGDRRGLERDGWYEVARRGSHVQLEHPTKPGRVTLLHPRRDLPKGTLRSIERQAGIRLR
jgi:YD repeat-containing protein